VAGTFRVAFAGTSTLHGFDGAVAPQALEVRLAAGADTWAAEANVPVAAINTGNAWRDANLRAMLDAERFPTIAATFPAIEPREARPASGKREGSLPFALRIRDVTRQVLGTTSAWRDRPGGVSFDVRFEVSLAAFGLEAPSTLGVVRVGDAVAVTVHVELHEAA
jgi:polyisoprenoid-binding protein YceI